MVGQYVTVAYGHAMTSLPAESGAIHADDDAPGGVAIPPVRPPPASLDERAQLERILSSAESPGVKARPIFLWYVVEDAGRRAGQPYQWLLGCDRGIHPGCGLQQDDPVVRIEAETAAPGERHYLIPGQDVSVRIDIPKDGYVPVFPWNDATQRRHGGGIAPRPGRTVVARKTIHARRNRCRSNSDDLSQLDRRTITL